MFAGNVARSFHGLDDQFDGGLVTGERRGEPALIADGGLVSTRGEERPKRVVDLDRPA